MHNAATRAQAAPRAGVLIAFEGLPRSGRSTQVLAMAERSARSGRAMRALDAPRATRLGRVVCGLVEERVLTLSSWRAEMLLGAAARAEAAVSVIGPALEAGDLVLAESFGASESAALLAAGAPAHEVRHAEDSSRHGLVPGMTVVLDVSPETAIARGAADGRNLLARARDLLLARAHADPERWMVIDGEPAADEITGALLTRICLSAL